MPESISAMLLGLMYAQLRKMMMVPSSKIRFFIPDMIVKKGVMSTEKAVLGNAWHHVIV